MTGVKPLKMATALKTMAAMMIKLRMIPNPPECFVSLVAVYILIVIFV